MFLLTKYGSPQPWSAEEVKIYVDKAIKELDQNPHIYQTYKRVSLIPPPHQGIKPNISFQVWAQKPFNSKPKDAETTSLPSLN